jgi:hypothetical protein
MGSRGRGEIRIGDVNGVRRDSKQGRRGERRDRLREKDTGARETLPEVVRFFSVARESAPVAEK